MSWLEYPRINVSICTGVSLIVLYVVCLQTGRAQPTKEDKDEFFKSLKQSAAGHLTLPILFFYKYLLKHGEEDGSPLIDKDLFFYIEVQKFKVSAELTFSFLPL